MNEPISDAGRFSHSTASTRFIPNAAAPRSSLANGVHPDEE
jgi:hypothetical protein